MPEKVLFNNEGIKLVVKGSIEDIRSILENLGFTEDGRWLPPIRLPKSLYKFEWNNPNEGVVFVSLTPTYPKMTPHRYWQANIFSSGRRSAQRRLDQEYQIATQLLSL